VGRPFLLLRQNLFCSASHALLILFVTFHQGNARAIVPNREMLMECLQLAKPTCIISVPALFNRVSCVFCKLRADGVHGRLLWPHAWCFYTLDGRPEIVIFATPCVVNLLLAS
jgi:hypothetical protein